jgi:hypothetical protein
MLEQAVIDAEALKEAALKNAEHAVLEKYSGEIKGAVESLLEQEEDPFADEDEMGLGGDEMGLGDEGGMEDRDEVADQLGMAATDGEKLCPCPEEEETVVLDLDKIAALAGMEAGEGGLGDEEELDLGDEEELFEVDDELNEKKEKTNEGELPPWLKKDKKDGDEEEEEDKKEKKDESIEIDENDLAEILEALVVDIDDVPHGKNFHTHPTKSESEYGLDVALAKEQDTDYAEQQKELRQAIKKLQEQVKSQKLKMNKQKKDYDNLKSVAMKATKKLEEVNFSNAKLIYTNRVLNSDSLNERQKEKLAEAISKVGSVEEAKIVFNTLQDNLSSKSQKAPKTLNEAVSKNNQLILKSNKEKQPANKNQVDRLKKLAGLI